MRITLLVLVVALSMSCGGEKHDSYSQALQKAVSTVDINHKKVILDSIFKEVQSQEDCPNRNRKLAQLAYEYKYIKDWDTFKGIAHQILRESSSYPSYRALANKFLGDYYMNQNKKNSALKYYLIAKNIVHFNCLSGSIKVIVYLSLCEFYHFVGDVRMAEEWAVKLMRCKNDLKDSLFSAYIWIGTAAENSLDYEKAEQYFQEALKISSGENYQIASHKAYALYRLSLLAFESNQLIESENLVQKALQNLPKNSDLDLKYLANEHLLYIKLLRGKNVSAAEGKLDTLFKNRRKDKVEIGKNYNRFYKSKYLMARGRQDDAIQSLQEALVISEEFGSVNDELFFRKELLAISPYFDKKNYSRIHFLKDSLKLKDRHARNKFARIAFEAEQIAEERDTANLQKWIVVGISGTLSIMLLIAMAFKNQKHRRRYNQLLQEQDELENKMLEVKWHTQQAVEEARIEQRREIARELHDGVMNNLASTRLNLSHAMEEPANKELSREFFAAKIEEVVSQLNRISGKLDVAFWPETANFTEAINRWVEQYQQYSPAEVTMTFTGNSECAALTSSQKLNLFRIIQETLLNAYKYASATRIELHFALSHEFFTATISDNGQGFSLEGPGGMGIQSMTRRAKDAGGTFKIRSAPGKGTITTINLPLVSAVQTA